MNGFYAGGLLHFRPYALITSPSSNMIPPFLSWLPLLSFLYFKAVLCRLPSFAVHKALWYSRTCLFGENMWMELASNLLRSEHSFVWCWDLDTSKSRSEIAGKFWNVLEKDGEHQLHGSCEKGEVLHRVKGEKSVIHTVKRRKANWIGHILRMNCYLKHVTAGKDRSEGKMRKKK